LAGLVVLALVLVPAAPASAASKVADAQKRANAAASRLAQAETALAKAEAEIARLQARADSAGARLTDAVSRVRALAVRRFMDSGARTTQWLDQTDVNQASRSQALLRYVLEGNADAVSEFRTAREDFASSKSAMAARLAQQQDAVKKLRQERADIEAELARLAAAAKAEEAKRAAAAAAAARKRGAPAPSPSPSAPKSVAVSGIWVCPVQGPHAFSNDYGQPRSGGRRHQGNDILAPRGTPVVANVGGDVSRHPNNLGGLSYYLHGDDGNTYYGAHLSAYAAQGRVPIGTVIGYVGNTGDAAGGPTHLHFEIHPGGGAAVNPYPTLVKYC
jgi:murein DD-endopeptidase MepM/ murein hydrolase activator NlpD